MNVHLNCIHLSYVFQSAYRQFHFTETALLKDHNDIALNMDTGKVTALTLLYLSAAIEHCVLPDRLSDWYGIWGIILTWILSFLMNKFQSIKIRKCYSLIQTIIYMHMTPKYRHLYLQQTLIFPLNIW